jgi:murein DD-endopeptidase MepM/ murein hydrolase activator NlpD
VANSFGVSVNTILWANNLAFTSYIREGQKLIIPPTTGVLHKVAKGDTVSRIARLYSATEEAINSYNELEDGGLKAGETIIVPGGRIIYTPKPSQSGTAYSNQTGRSSSVKVNDSDIPVSSGGRMAWPSACQRISQYYRGWLHTGVDIACPWGTSVRAAESGVVTRVQYGKTGYGYNVIISHGGGKETLYGHLSKIMVSAGDRVEKGQIIANEGSTGRSTGPHLHFEIRINGSRVNPLSYIR